MIIHLITGSEHQSNRILRTQMIHCCIIGSGRPHTLLRAHALTTHQEEQCGNSKGIASIIGL